MSPPINLLTLAVMAAVGIGMGIYYLVDGLNQEEPLGYRPGRSNNPRRTRNSSPPNNPRRIRNSSPPNNPRRIRNSSPPNNPRRTRNSSPPNNPRRIRNSSPPNNPRLIRNSSPPNNPRRIRNSSPPNNPRQIRHSSPLRRPITPPNATPQASESPPPQVRSTCSDGLLRRTGRPIVDCKICNTSRNDPLITLECRHIFHSECYTIWRTMMDRFKAKKICPECHPSTVTQSL